MLASWIFWTAVACCAAAQIAIFRSTLIARGTVGAEAVPRPGRTAEMLWVILPALMLAAVLFFTWRAIGHGDATRRPGASVSARSSAIGQTSSGSRALHIPAAALIHPVRNPLT